MSPQATETTFAFSSVFFLLLWFERMCCQFGNGTCVCVYVCVYVCVCAIFNLKTDENTISILIVRVIVANIT